MVLASLPDSIYTTVADSKGSEVKKDSSRIKCDPDLSMPWFFICEGVSYCRIVRLKTYLYKKERKVTNL